MTSETDFSRVAELMVPYSVDALVSKPEAAAKLVPVLREVLSHKRHTASGRADEARAHARSIVRALALRDCETEAHCERVAAWSRKLATEMGLPPVRVLDVELGALLHDVGKIGVRDNVLLKPGPLTPEEWREMRKHPELGAALLAEIPVLSGAVPIVKCHHERLDGKGYPHGLEGDDVPIDARIFQVIDAYDAIVSDRPYRKGQSDAVARQEVMRMVGSQFDETVVETFMRIDVVDWLAVGQSAVAQATIAPPDDQESWQRHG
jgi:putative nucleotidyltransferase with HDIG domain